MAIKNSGKNPGTKSGFRIEVFRSGTFKPMSGGEISYGADDLAGIASGYDPDNSPGSHCDRPPFDGRPGLWLGVRL